MPVICVQYFKIPILEELFLQQCIPATIAILKYSLFHSLCCFMNRKVNFF